MQGKVHTFIKVKIEYWKKDDLREHTKIDLATKLKQLLYNVPKNSCSEISRKACVETTPIHTNSITYIFRQIFFFLEGLSNHNLKHFHDKCLNVCTINWSIPP